MAALRHGVRQFVAGGEDEMAALNAAAIARDGRDAAPLGIHIDHFGRCVYRGAERNCMVQQRECRLARVDREIAVAHEGGIGLDAEALSQVGAIEEAYLQARGAARITLPLETVRVELIAGEIE